MALTFTSCSWPPAEWSLLHELGFSEVQYRALNPARGWTPKADYMGIYLKACREGIRPEGKGGV